MYMPRSSGILLHPSSLPGSDGIGSLGKEAFRFVDWLKEARQTLWQVLPLGPTGYGDSPYASLSTFAGNPLLIDIDTLADWGCLSAKQASEEKPEKTDRIDFGSVVQKKIPLLKTAARQFLADGNASSAQTALHEEYENFKKEHDIWLSDYALFMSIKEVFDEKAKKEENSGALWNNYWSRDLASHQTQALSVWQAEHKDDIEIHKAVQFFFFKQWFTLKKYANARGVCILGDIPIFVAADSADVWSHQNLFQLDENGQPTVLAGVPPDYFSKTGQLWGNPLYNWDAMKNEGYDWWIRRLRHALHLTDYVRIDHFRGFEAYWAVPAGEQTAVNGTWMQGPGADLFCAVCNTLKDAAIIAEDLGVITDGVRNLLKQFGFPGMKVLQFAFDTNEAGGAGCTNPFLPHMYEQNSVVYTGTHDNDTTQGWLNHASEAERALVNEYVCECIPGLKLTDEQLCPALIGAAFFSAARFAVIPLQDLFALGSEARMNTPSTCSGANWSWRMKDSQFSAEQAERLKRLSQLSGRNTENGACR